MMRPPALEPCVRTTQPELTVLLPGLVAPLRSRQAAGVPRPETPALAALCARSRVDHPPAQSFEHTALRLAGLPIPEEPPVGAIRRLGLGMPADDAVWMAADPVHIHPDLNGAVLFEGPDLQVRDEEAQALCASFDAYWGEAGLHLEPTRAGHWHLRLPREIPVTTTSLRQVRGHDPFPGMPRDGDRGFWWRLLNETQMLFHTHPVNRARTEAGLPTLNGLWIWGAGSLPPPATEVPAVASDDPFLQGLARLHPAGHFEPVPAQPHAWLSALAPGAHLLHLDHLARPADYNDPPAWEDGLQRLDRDWFQALEAVLRAGRLRRLRLVDPGGLHLTAAPGRWRGLWRRRDWAGRLTGARR